MTDIQKPTDPDHELVERLFRLHPPKDAYTAGQLDGLRAQFTNLAHTVVVRAPRTPDRTIALRSLHRACMDAIVAIVCNQEETTS